MPSSHYAIFQELESLTFQELKSSQRLVEIMRAKIGLLNPSQFADQRCSEIVRVFAELLRDVLEDRYQDVSIRAFAHICVALDYFIDPAEQIPDADPGGFVDDLQFLIRTEQRFQRDLQKYRDWRKRTGQPS
jgi:uncharacterized membrane protein YkvA (DUF1232 family)